jgi:hypothetical protein
LGSADGISDDEEILTEIRSQWELRNIVERNNDRPYFSQAFLISEPVFGLDFWIRSNQPYTTLRPFFLKCHM